MAEPKLTKLEMQVMDVLWATGPLSVRSIQEAFPEKNRPAYTTVQTIVYRLEAKKAVRRVRKAGHAHIFEAVVTRTGAHRRLLEELLTYFGGKSQAVVAGLIETGRLTLEDVRQAEQLLTQLEKEKKDGRGR
jgi:BlaI family transcriptional regulator, penicillinase repressor